MTFREKIADWISGGALSEARQEAKHFGDEAYSALGVIERNHEAYKSLKAVKDAEYLGRLNAIEALVKISAMETPSAAHAAKKMAAVANKALGKTNDPVRLAP
ncbi:MAG: hypothetical protein Unbinned7865contig1001_6 [Prokaryotic dsDNA virus sp.]|nr:MAG: hypothetical protein Unbinned7865contig1001_6 [Prokaryotic dsDNA virus sp.]|tara:strand:- start:22049 stop:22357 length:309 start_codon:yes stop_codon:yes gene_type:complete